MKKRIAFLMLLSVLCLSVLAASNSWADKYLGETTWTVTITDSSDNQSNTTFTLTGGINKINSHYFLFQGYVIPPSDLPYILSGSGVLVGNNLVLTLTSSQEHTSQWCDTGILHASLNMSTLSGTFYEVRTDLSPTKTYAYGYSIGTLTLSGKEIPLNPIIPANQMLLLDN